MSLTPADLKAIKSLFDDRFDQIDNRFDQMEQRFDDKLSSVEERLEQKIQQQAEQQTAELVDMMNKIMFSADEHFATKGELRQVQKQVKRISFKIGLST